jgi:hypothetical protein
MHFAVSAIVLELVFKTTRFQTENTPTADAVANELQ